MLQQDHGPNNSHCLRKKIWVLIDQTTVNNRRYIANVIIISLDIDCSGKIIFLISEVFEKFNHSTIAKLFNESMALLWSNGVQLDYVLLLVCNAVTYMVKRHP